MIFSVNDPKHWRDCADEARLISQTVADQRARGEMLTAAAVYDQLANLAQAGPLLRQLKSVSETLRSVKVWSNQGK